MGDTLKKVTKEERRKEFRRRVIGDFIILCQGNHEIFSFVEELTFLLFFFLKI